MALTEKQRIECRTILRPDYSDLLTVYGITTDFLDSKLKNLSDAQEELVIEVLEEWEKIKFKAGELKGEFNQRDADRKGVIRSRLVDILELPFETGPSLTIGRG